VPKYLELPEINYSAFNDDAILPYDLSVKNIIKTIELTNKFLYDLNNYLVSHKYSRLEETLLMNAFAGLISEINVKNLSDACESLVRNVKVGGYPDLIPVGLYEGNSVLRGKGIEVKSSKQVGGWQGHNPEKGHLIVFRYSVDVETMPIENREPTYISHVYVAELEEEDWNFSGRSSSSRRTITASINRKGMKKLRGNWVYNKDIKPLTKY